MIYATSSSSTTLETANGEGTPADLQTQLEKMRSQLQDRSARPSAKTAEGKAKIREIARKADVIQQRIQQIQLDKVQTQAPVQPQPQLQDLPQLQRARMDPATVLGGRVDVYA
jgi:shikimate kinase